MKLRWLILPLLLLMPIVWTIADAESCIRFKAPGGAVDPGQRDPEDPPTDDPTDDPDDDPTDNPTQPDPTSPVTPRPDPTPPTTPKPNLPTTPSGNPNRKGPAQDFTTWETWWELNRVEFFPRRFVRPEITPKEGELIHAGPQQLHPDRVAHKLWPALLKLKDHKHVFVREAALISLGRAAANEEQRAEARGILLKALKDRNRLVARSAALGLFYVADDTSVFPMYQVAANEKTDEDVRAFLALTLTNLKHPTAQTLLQGLADTRKGYYELVSAALMGLGYSHAASEDRMIPELLEEIAFSKKGVRKEFRALAVESFGRIGSIKGIPQLIKGLQDRDTPVRRSAAIALGVLDYRTDAERKIEAIEAPYKEYIGVPMTDEDRTRIQTLRAEIQPQRQAMLKKVKTATKKLAEAMTRDNDAFVRRMAAVSLGRLHKQNPQPLAIRYLRAAIKKNRVGMREYALLALAIANGDGAQEIALQKLKERNPSTRGAACIALGLIADKDREKPISEADRKICDDALRNVIRKDRHPTIRGYAALATGLVGNASAADEILSMVMKTKAPTPRAYGALGLAMLGTKKGADEIVGFLRSGQMRNGFVASHMVYAIGLTKDRRTETFDALIEKAVDGNDQYVQAATIAALGYLSSGEFYPRRHLMARGYNYLLGLDYIDTYFYKL